MKNDIKIIKNPGEARRYNAEDRTTSSQTATMKPGEPVKGAGTGRNFVYLLADGDPEVGTDIFIGIVAEESTETSTADGTVLVHTLLPNTMLRGKATTAANINTAAKLLALKGDYVAFDLAAGVFTIDEDEGDDPNVHGLCIIDGDIVKGTLDVIPQLNATEHAPTV